MWRYRAKRRQSIHLHVNSERVVRSLRRCSSPGNAYVTKNFCSINIETWTSLYSMQQKKNDRNLKNKQGYYTISLYLDSRSLIYLFYLIYPFSSFMLFILLCKYLYTKSNLCVSYLLILGLLYEKVVVVNKFCDFMCNLFTLRDFNF